MCSASTLRDQHTPELITASIVGRGYCSDVYAWGDGQVLKLFHGPLGRARAEREYRATRAVHAAGLPAPAAYELLEIDNRWGVVLERINGPSLFEAVQAKPWTLFDAVRKLSELHAAIHACAAPAELPAQRDWLANSIDAAGLSEADRRAARSRLSELPDGSTLCHGDFHPANVLITPRGPVVIDWDTATRGHPLGDVAGTCWLLRHAELPDWSPGYMHLMLRCFRPTLLRGYLRHYLRLRPGSYREIEAWRLPLEARGARFEPETLRKSKAEQSKAAVRI
ncbi:MAG TPA: aminoglycoside phosphotransferase family protein [Gemmataceae bacterium]|nr:aminoglycoside phosphotransferase family protein [Gemmataceae bacterium]